MIKDMDPWFHGSAAGAAARAAASAAAIALVLPRLRSIYRIFGTHSEFIT